MKLGKLIKRLVEIQKKLGDDTAVTLMEEHELNGRIVQFASHVTDIANTTKEVVIIGQELLVPDFIKKDI